MTKAEFIAAVADKLGQPKTATGDTIETVFGVMVEAIKAGKFAYPGFGTFTLKERAARMGRNPSTGAPVQIKASKNVGFKAAPALKESL